MNFTDTNEIFAQTLKYCQGDACFLWDARTSRGKLYSCKSNLLKNDLR